MCHVLEWIEQENGSRETQGCVEVEENGKFGCSIWAPTPEKLLSPCSYLRLLDLAVSGHLTCNDALKHMQTNKINSAQQIINPAREGSLQFSYRVQAIQTSIAKHPAWPSGLLGGSQQLDQEISPTEQNEEGNNLGLFHCFSTCMSLAIVEGSTLVLGRTSFTQPEVVYRLS